VLVALVVSAHIRSIARPAVDDTYARTARTYHSVVAQPSVFCNQLLAT
jgi:hypothetical protein